MTEQRDGAGLREQKRTEICVGITSRDVTCLNCFSQEGGFKSDLSEWPFQ